MTQLSSNYDVVFIGIILFSAVMALIRGGVSEILSLSVWFLAFAFMRNFSSLIDGHIPPSVTNPLFRSVIVFIIAFIVIAIFVAILKKLCASIISSIGLGGLNYLIGAAIGIVRGILICAILVIVVEMLKFDPSHAWQKSRLYPVINPVVEWIAKSVPNQINELPKPPKLLPSYY